MDCVRKACNQFSPFYLKNLKRERRQAEEMIAKNKPSVFDFDGDDDDDDENLGFSIVNSSRKRDANNNIENKCYARTSNKKMTPSKLDIPKDPRLNKSTIEKTESSGRKEMTNKREETQCKSGHKKTPEKEDLRKLTDNPRSNTKTVREDPECPAKRRRLYENATGLLKEVEKTLKHIREETRTGDKDIRRKEESENKTVQKKLLKTSEAPILNSPKRTNSGEVTCCDKSNSDAATEGKETSTGKIKDRNIANIESKNEDPKNTIKEASDEKTGKAQGKSIDDIDTDMLVVRSPTELAEVTDPFELQRMGYEFMVAATARLQEEKSTAHDEIKVHLSTIHKLKSELMTETKRALMQNDNYEQQIGRLKVVNESLEENLKIQTESLEKQEQKIKEMNEEIERKEEKATEVKENLENKIQVLLEENKKLTNEAGKANELIKSQQVKICAIPGAVQFFLRKFLEEGVWSKVKEERKNSTDEESENKGNEKKDEAENIFEKMTN